jgi:hypothetical protein
MSYAPSRLSPTQSQYAVTLKISLKGRKTLQLGITVGKYTSSSFEPHVVASLTGEISVATVSRRLGQAPESQWYAVKKFTISGSLFTHVVRDVHTFFTFRYHSSCIHQVIVIRSCSSASRSTPRQSLYETSCTGFEVGCSSRAAMGFQTSSQATGRG